MAKYRKKPVVIEAVQFTGKNHEEIGIFVGYDGAYMAGEALVIRTLEDGKEGVAKHVADPGDWIIKGVAGEFYPCKPGIFAATYEPA